MSFNLLVGGTISVGASTGALVDIAIFGDEIATTAPTDTFKTLFQGTLAIGPTTVYTVTGPVTMTIVKTVTLVNSAGSGAVTVTFTVNGTGTGKRIPGVKVPDGGTAIWENNGWVVQDANSAVITTAAVITASGDATGTQSGTNLPLTLATVNASPGTTGDASHSLTAVVNGKGLVTSFTANSIQITESQVTGLVTDLSNKQPLDTGLTSLAGLTGTGLVASTATDAFTNRTLTSASTAALTVANGDGAAGNPTLTVDATVVALAGLDATAGMVVETAADTFTKRSLAAGSSSVSITNPAGVAGNPTVDVMPANFTGIPESGVTNLVSDLAGKQATGNYITATTGDVTATGPGTVAATLATVNSNVGTFGDASHSVTVQADGKGRILAISQSAISGGGNNFGVVTGNTGTANSDTPGDTIAVTGRQYTGITTIAADTPDGLVIVGDSLSAQNDFGFVDDLRGVGDGTCSSGTPGVITSATAAFVNSASTAGGDIGKRITLAGAGAAGAMYVGTISSVNSATSVNVSPNITTTVSNRALQLGTDNTTAETNLDTFVNTTTATYPGFMLHWEHSSATGRTGRYGFTKMHDWTRPFLNTGDSRGFTADQGVADQVGGVWLCWWGTTCDDGTPFKPFLNFRSNQNNNMKGTGFRDISIDCSNGSQYGQVNQYNTNALIGVGMKTVNGFSWDNVFIRNPGAIGLWTDIDSTPTEQESVSRGIIQNLAFRCLDSGPSMITTPFLMTSAVTLTASGQSLTVAANSLQTAGYIWTQTTVGRPVLVQYTGGGGSTTLTGCRVSTEDAIYAPVTVNGGNIVSACPSNSAAALLSGNTTANTNLSMFQMWQINHGTTWGPAAIECANADSITLQQIVINGGSAAATNAINRLTKPGVRFNGHNTSLPLAARNNVFYDGDAGAGGVSNMALLNTGAAMTAPAGPNYWFGYQLGNAAPQPNIELGGYLDWSPNGGVAVPGLRNMQLSALANYTASSANTVIGSAMLLPPQAFQLGTTFRWRIGWTKTGAGTANRNINIRVGSTGTASDANISLLTFGTTATADSGIFDIICRCNSLSAGTASVDSVALVIMRTLIAGATGLVSTAGPVQANGTGSGFSAPVSGLQYISLSVTPGASEALTPNHAFAYVDRIGNQAA